MTTGKKLQSTTPYPYIPYEIIFFGILNRLPVKSLLRFSCINKLWYATIRDPEFVHSHSIHAKANSSSSLVGVFQFKHTDSNHYLFVNKDGGHVNFRFQTGKGTCRVGYCNGLFCFRSRYGFEICNPSRREFFYDALPPQTPPRCLICYGFGFDPLKNEYKVIQIVNGNGNFRRCMVYTLGSTWWKDITDASNLLECLDYRYLQGPNGLGGVVNADRAHYSNGALHWFFRRAHEILSFDIHSEKFSLIPGPGPYYFSKCCRCFFLEWKGRMCIAYHNLPGRYLKISIFMPEKYHILDSKKSYKGNTVCLPYKVTSAIGVLGGGTVFYWFSKGNISLYTLDSNGGQYVHRRGKEKIENFPLPLDMDYALLGENELFPYMDNLQSLKTLVPSCATKEKNLLRVKSVSSL